MITFVLLKRWASNVTVEPVLLFYMLASFISYGVFQDLLYLKVCNDVYDDRTKCRQLETRAGDKLTDLQSESSHWMLYNNIALFVPSILVACWMGAWADRNGRKIPMLTASFSTMLYNLILMVIASWDELSVAYLLVANFVMGLGGGYVILIASVMSYISDMTTCQARTTRVAVLESMTFLASAVGPLVSGYMLKGTSHVSVFLFCFMCNAFVVIYVIVRVKDVVPSKAVEEVPVEVTTATQRRWRPSVCQNFHESLMVCFKERSGYQKVSIIVVLVACICIFLASAAETYLTYLYVKDEPLRWEYFEYSTYQSLHSGIGAFMLLFGLPALRHWFAFEDSTFVFVGLLSRTCGLLLLAFTSTSAMMFMVPVAAVFAIFPAPCYRSVLSKLVLPSEQGKIFSVLATIENLCAVTGSLIYNSLYPLTNPIFHGFCFLVAVGFVAIAFALTCYFRFVNRFRSQCRYVDIASDS